MNWANKKNWQELSGPPDQKHATNPFHYLLVEAALPLVVLLLCGRGFCQEELHSVEELNGEVGHEVGVEDVGVEQHQQVHLLPPHHLTRAGCTHQGEMMFCNQCCESGFRNFFSDPELLVTNPARMKEQILFLILGL